MDGHKTFCQHFRKLTLLLFPGHLFYSFFPVKEDIYISQISSHSEKKLELSMEGKASSGLNSIVSMSASLTAFLFPVFIPAKLRSRITSVHWGKGVGEKRLPERKRKDSDPSCLSIMADANLRQPTKQLGTQAPTPRQHLKTHVYPFTSHAKALQ